MAQICKCLIVDDHQLFIDGLERILSDVPDFSVVGILTDGKNLISKIQENEVDLVLLDMQLAGISGLELCSELRKVNSVVKIILISMIQAPHILKEAEKNGANGFIPKTTDASELKKIISKICHGEHIFHSEGIQNSEINLLTDREMEIIYLIKQGQKQERLQKNYF
jgi:DNA-binding NarL/FixJ family response regulator